MPRAVDIFVGQQIRDRRIEFGLTQAQLAAAVRVTAEQMNDHEHGVERVDPETLANIAVALNCSLGWLFGTREKQRNLASARPVSCTARERVDELSLLLAGR
jgi:transcriptional regulator with XRE-family HTH domain